VLFLLLITAAPPGLRIIDDPFTKTAYVVAEPGREVSSPLTKRQRNDDTGFVLTALSGCRGHIVAAQDAKKVSASCAQGPSSAYITYLHQRFGKIDPKVKLSKHQIDLQTLDKKAMLGDFGAARKGYQALAKRSLGIVSRLSELSDAELCWRMDDKCPTLDEWAPENAEESERLITLRLTQGRAEEALSLAEKLKSLRGFILHEHALAMVMREKFLAHDDLKLVAFYFENEESIDTHGDAHELHLLVMHALYEMEDEDVLRKVAAKETVASASHSKIVGTLRALPPPEEGNAP
jgi:hypothetical protein